NHSLSLDDNTDQILSSYLPDISILSASQEEDELEVADITWEDMENDDKAEVENVAPNPEFYVNNGESAYRIVRGPKIETMTLEEPLTLPQKLMITLVSSGDKVKDKLRMKRIHGVLISCPGRDRFSFKVIEKKQCYTLEFPNLTTGLNDLALNRLRRMIGEDNVEITPL
ncbi:MAG: hypothetical protein MUO40_08605, partial [Anaerolineaceae bacterium]|nr:hypothetical protein [Anaerolineaceae bacterium]